MGGRCRRNAHVKCFSVSQEEKKEWEETFEEDATGFVGVYMSHVGISRKQGTIRRHGMYGNSERIFRSPLVGLHALWRDFHIPNSERVSYGSFPNLGTSI